MTPRVRPASVASPLSPLSPLPPAPLSEPPSPATLTARLLAWGQDQGRSLPWRTVDAEGRRDPYRTWVSEIMLQQTQVSTVLPYFERWLTRFPTVEALAAAPPDDALKAWEGLGYYARARHLHRAAQIVVAQQGGHLPRTRAELASLPGIGRSTLGAILSLAFGQRAAVLDGNLKRVLSRVFDVDTPLGQAATEARLWALSEALVMTLDRDDQAGPLNEALMDLGATVCLPRSPACLACPLTGHCLAQVALFTAPGIRLVAINRPCGEGCMCNMFRLLVPQPDGGWKDYEGFPSEGDINAKIGKKARSHEFLLPEVGTDIKIIDPETGKTLLLIGWIGGKFGIK